MIRIVQGVVVRASQQAHACARLLLSCVGLLGYEIAQRNARLDEACHVLSKPYRRLPQVRVAPGCSDLSFAVRYISRRQRTTVCRELSSTDAKYQNAVGTVEGAGMTCAAMTSGSTLALFWTLSATIWGMGGFAFVVGTRSVL